MRAPITSPHRLGCSGLLIVRATLLCCALTLASSAALAVENTASQVAHRQSTASAPQGKTKQDQGASRLDTSSLEKTIREVVKEQAEKHDTHADEHAQKEGELVEHTRQLAVETNRLAEFTLFLVICTAVMAAIAFGQLLMFWRQLGLMREDSKSTKAAAEAAKKSADASLITLRPWLSCKVKIMEALTFNEAGDPIFRFRFSVRNVGNTPAMSVHLDQELRLFAPGVQHSVLRLQTLAALTQGLGVQKPNKELTFTDVEKATAQGQVVNPVGHVLFPGEVLMQYLQMPISKKWILECSKDMKEGEIHFWPELIVLVSYVYNMAETHATTGLVFNISKPRLMPFKLGESVPVEDIDVALHHMWGGFAT